MIRFCLIAILVKNNYELESYRKSKNIHTKNTLGYTDLELDIFTFKNHINKDKFRDCLGVVTVSIIKGDIVFYKHDVIKALTIYYEKEREQKKIQD